MKFTLLFAALLTLTVPIQAQGVPGWAEPSEPFTHEHNAVEDRSQSSSIDPLPGPPDPPECNECLRGCGEGYTCRYVESTDCYECVKDAADVPVDGGLIWLVLVGLGLAVYKLGGF